MQLGCYHNHDARPSTNRSKEWHCPACQDLSKEQRETWHRRTESEIWLVNWEPAWEAAKMIRSNHNYVKLAEEYERSTMSTSSTRNEPTDKHMDNLARLGLENPNRRISQWKFTLGKYIRDKVHFDMKITDLQNDIKGTCN